MLENLLKTIMDKIRSVGTAAGQLAEKYDLPPLPSVQIETRVEAMYAQGLVGKVRNRAIREIVVHGTACNGYYSIANFLKWMLSGEQAANYNQGIALFHYLISREGEIVQVIDPKYVVYHSLSGLHDWETVGIELMALDVANAGTYTDAQYTALAGLCDRLMRQNPLCRQIVSHNHNGLTYSRQGKSCPGPAFSWTRLVADLLARKWPNRLAAEEVIHVA